MAIGDLICLCGVSFASINNVFKLNFPLFICPKSKKDIDRNNAGIPFR